MTKIKTTLTDEIIRYASDIGLGVMTLATVVGMLELPDHAATSNRYVLPGQVVRVEANDLNELNNPIRRENEETSQQFVSYSESQRTPARSGRY